MFRYVALGVVEAALLLAAVGLGRAMATPVVSVQQVPVQTSLQARPLSGGPQTRCAVTGDLVGDANPAEVARSLCASR